MEIQFAKYKEMGDFVLQYGKDMLIALAVLTLGLIAAKYIRKQIDKGLGKVISKKAVASTISNILYVLILFMVVGMALDQAGMPADSDPGMAFVLVQLGKSLPKEKDPAKGLSDTGRQETLKIADVAKMHPWRNWTASVR